MMNKNDSPGQDTARKSSDLTVVQVHMSLQAGIGGPATIGAIVCQAMAKLGCRVRICCANWGPAFGEPIRIDNPLVTTYTARGVRWKVPRIWLVPGFARVLRKAAAGSDVFHLHGFWVGMNHCACRLAKDLGIPYLISPEGNLTPHSLSQKRWKKAIIKRVYVNRDLRGANCMHALSIQEHNDIRAFGLRNPVAIIPNALNLEDFESLPPRQVALDLWPELRGRKIVLFLGRIHPHKGLSHLVAAWCRLARRSAPWHLVIAGPDEVGLRAELEALAREAQCQETITFTGPVYGDKKLALLAAADMFVLPSFSEGHSMGLLEAMACRVPILTTPGSNFQDGAQAGAGILTAPDVDATEQGLAELMGLSDAERAEMGRRGRALLEERYTAPRIAAQYLELYDWLRGRGSKPAFVYLDGETPR